MTCDEHEGKVDCLTTHNNILTKKSEEAFEKLKKYEF